MAIQHTVLAVVIGLGCASAFTNAPAIAGPCTADINDLGRTLSQSPVLGPATTGTLQGAGPTAASAVPADKPGSPTTTGTSADNRVGGTLGTKEANAAVGNLVATSPQDVRRQSQGLPTAAAAAAAAGHNSVETVPRVGSAQQEDRSMAEAKMALERARTLDHDNNPACKDAIEQTRKLMQAS